MYVNTFMNCKNYLVLIKSILKITFFLFSSLALLTVASFLLWRGIVFKNKKTSEEQKISNIFHRYWKRVSE